MKGCDKQVTIYRSEWDPDKGHDVWIGQCLKGVSFHARCLTTVGKDGLSAAMEAVMRVPATAMPQCPENAFDKRVIHTGDIVVLGRVPQYNFLDGVSPEKLKEMLTEKEIEKRAWEFPIGRFSPQINDKQYSATRYIWTVVGVTDNLDGRCPHIKVVMK